MRCRAGNHRSRQKGRRGPWQERLSIHALSSASWIAGSVSVRIKLLSNGRYGLATLPSLVDAGRGCKSHPSHRPGSAMTMIERLTADLICLQDAWRALQLTTPIAKNPTRIFPTVIDELAEKFGDAPALLSDRERFTYRELAERSNRYARWALAQGIDKGDTVCLLMPNRPEFLALWLGINRVGGVVALLNTNLTGPALAHCINVVTPKHIIVAAELLASLQTAKAAITGNAKLWLHGEADANLPRLDREVRQFAGDILADSERRMLTVEDRALFIYTSGTTGLPKAANMNHYRVMLACHAFAGVMDTRATDRMYDCLPMYHTAGGLLA